MTADSYGGWGNRETRGLSEVLQEDASLRGLVALRLPPSQCHRLACTAGYLGSIGVMTPSLASSAAAASRHRSSR